MTNKKNLIVFFVLISLFFMFGSTVLADGGDVPEALCGEADTILSAPGYDGILKESCGLEIDEEGVPFYFEKVYVSSSFSYDFEDEDFFAWLTEYFGMMPFETVDELKIALEESGRLSFEIVNEDGAVVYVDILDGYISDVVMRKSIEDVYADYEGFYQRNLNEEVMNLGGLGYLLNDSYALVGNSLTVHLIDVETWDENQWLERSLVLNLGDDFETVKADVFSSDFEAKYVDQLRMDIMTNEGLISEKEDMLSSGFYDENEVDYVLRDFGLREDVAGDWMKISLINGIELAFVFNEAVNQLEIRQSFDRLDVPIGTLGLLFGEDFAGINAETVVDLLHPDLYPFADFSALDVFEHHISRVSDGRIVFTTMFDYPITVSSWKNAEENQETFYDEWLMTQSEDEQYLSYIDAINTVNTKLVIKSVIIDNKAQFEYVFEKNFNEALFAMGDVADFSERAEFVMQLINYNDDEDYGYLSSQRIYALGDDYDVVKAYMLSEAYYEVLKAENVSNFHFIDPNEDASAQYMFITTDPLLLFGVNGIPIRISFIDNREQISIIQYSIDPSKNLVDFIEPIMTIESLGFDCVGGRPSQVLATEPIELEMSFDYYDVANSMEYLNGVSSDGIVFDRYPSFSFEYNPQTKNIIFTLGGEAEQTKNMVSFVVYEDWRYSPVAGEGIGDLNARFVENFGIEANEGIPVLIDSFQTLFLEEFGITFEEFVSLPMLQYNEPSFY